MSHFSVLVRVPSAVNKSGLESHVGKMMLPYKETDDTNCPPELRPALVFEDNEDENLADYNTKTASMVRLADGSEISAYDDRLRNPEPFDTPQYIIPPGAIAFEKPHRELYATFEQYMAEYCGSKRNATTRRYGYWSNPNAKWDWWCIGGRWTGKLHFDYRPESDRDNYEPCFICGGSGTRHDFTYGPGDTFARQPTPAGHPVIGRGCNSCRGTGWTLKFASKLKPVGNYSRINAINMAVANIIAIEKLNAFWSEWQDFCSGKPFDGPREQALSFGMIECKGMDELTGGEWKVIPWDKADTPEDKRRNRCDVLKDVTKEWVAERFIDSFNPLSTWARLDADGWKERGKMGWFGCGSDTPESTQAFANSLQGWLTAGDQDDWIVVVDCHI